MPTADRHLLFGLLALQNGIINQVQLVAAFHAWTLDRSKSLADHLEARGDLSSAKRRLLESLAEVHLEANGGDVEKSLAAVSAGKSTREDLERIGDLEINASLGHVAPAHRPTEDDDFDRTSSVAVGSATSGGQRFRVLRPHAKGGLGAVFVALDGELHREVALKQILDHHADDPTSRARFVQEAEITGGLEHPGIVPVYGLGTYAGGRPYYAMRFIEGDSLKEAIEHFHADGSLNHNPGRRSLELRKLLRRFTDICDAIGYAHSRGILHRDIKPGNIIVGKHGETLVVDWGLAKATGKSESGSRERTLLPSSASGSADTLPGSALGTPAYMSPEQARGELDLLGPRSDVYGLGATLYCLLTGRPPFEGEDIGEMLRKVQGGEFARPRQVDPTLDPALEAVCLKAMATSPEGRYASCRALADDVERWAADEPVTAWAEPWSRKLLRWLTRHRTAVTGSAAAVLAGVVGLLAVLIVATQANSRLTRANTELETANRRVTKANADLNSANEREKQRFNLAMEAIKLFHGQVSDDLVLKADSFKPLRDKLLRGAADFYGKLEGLLKDQPDRASRAAIGNAYFELGELTATIGDKPGALAAHRKGLAVRRELASGPAADAQAPGDLASSLSSVAGLLSETGDPAGALASYEEARGLLEGIPLSGPGADGRRALLGRVYRGIAIMLATTGKTAEAISAHGRSVEILTRLADDNPTVTDFRSQLAKSLHTLSDFQWGTGNAGDAMESCRRAVAIEQKLADDNPTVADFRGDLAKGYNLLGELQQRTGNVGEGIKSYRRALAILQKLADDNPAVTQYRFDMGNNFISLGWQQSRTGSPAEAMESYRRAVAILQKLADDDPAVTRFRAKLAHAHHVIGMLQSDTHQHGDALESFGRTLAIKQKLADDHPTVNQFLGTLAVTHNSVGNLLLRMDQPDRALESFRNALTIFQKMADGNPAVPEWKHLVAMTQGNIGIAQFQIGKPLDGLESYRRSAAVWQKLADENPTVTEFQHCLTLVQGNIGEGEARIGEPGKAAESFRRALALSRKLVSDNPAVTEYRADLAGYHRGLSDAVRTLGRPDEALAGYGHAIAILEELGRSSPGLPENRLSLASSLGRRGMARLTVGDAAGAVADARRALALYEGLPSISAEHRYEQACFQAMLVQAAGRKDSGIPAGDSEAEAGKAMALLRRAVAEGFRDAGAVAKEPALDPLRDRPDFRLLLMDMAFPAESFGAGDRGPPGIGDRRGSGTAGDRGPPGNDCHVDFELVTAARSAPGLAGGGSVLLSTSPTIQRRERTLTSCPCSGVEATAPATMAPRTSVVRTSIATPRVGWLVAFDSQIYPDLQGGSRRCVSELTNLFRAATNGDQSPVI